MPTDPRKTWAWIELTRWAKQYLPWVCHLCNQAIPRHVPNRHPLAYQLDHLLTVKDHPELGLRQDNVAPSHRQCNNWRRTRPITPGLRVEIADKAKARTPVALAFFGIDEDLTNETAGEGGSELQDPAGAT